MSEKKGRFKKELGFIIVCFVLILFVVFVIVILSYDKRTEVATTITSSETDTLLCNSGPIEDAFFSTGDASQVKHDIKIMFVEDKIAKLFYMYDGKFRDEEIAEKVSTSMHIDYDKYLSERKLESSRNLQSTFNHPGTEVRVDIYTGPEGINGDTASFFFLNKDDLDNLMKKDSESLKKYYTEKGFSCKILD